MTNDDYNFRTFRELLEEKSRLKNVISEEQEKLSNTFAVIRGKLTPSSMAMSVLRPRRENSISKEIVTNGIGLLANTVFPGGGWLSRLLVPLVVKNVASTAIEHKDTIARVTKGIFRLFSKKKRLPGAQPTEE